MSAQLIELARRLANQETAFAVHTNRPEDLQWVLQVRGTLRALMTALAGVAAAPREPTEAMIHAAKRELWALIDLEAWRARGCEIEEHEIASALQAALDVAWETSWLVPPQPEAADQPQP